MIAAYYLFGQDNDSFFLDDEKKPNAPVCGECGFLLDPVNYFNPFFHVKRTRYDFSYTHDQRPIVSLAFQEFCVREGFKDLIFKGFERDPNFFYFKPQSILELDVEKSQPRFEKRCATCGNWQGTYLNKVMVKNLTKPLHDGFYRTDVLFSHGNRKHPLIIVGLETLPKLIREKFSGIVSEPIDQ